MLKVLDLFSGIGGFSLGLEATGEFSTVAFCEIDKSARLVLEKRWPGVPCFPDIQTLTKDSLNDIIGVQEVNILTGGFPCQDISNAGKTEGLQGPRSKLWFEMLRLIEDLKPSYAIIENVSALRNRGLDTVLSGLYKVGYDAEWHCIPASALGAPHQRDRIWIVAYPMCSRRQVRVSEKGYWEEGHTEISYYLSNRLLRWQRESKWPVEPSVGRVANGIPRRVDRLRQLGNSIVPPIAYLIGKSILDVEKNKQ